MSPIRRWDDFRALPRRGIVLARRQRIALVGGALLLKVWDAHLASAIARLVETSQASSRPLISISEAPWWRARGLARRGHIVLPKFTTFEVAARATPMARDLSRRWERCPARAYQVSVRRDAASFDFFYERLYRPTMTSRHGGDAYIRSSQYLRSGFSRGFLLFLTSGDTVLAGALNVLRSREGGIADHWAGGVLSGDPELVRDGADLALVVRSRQWAERIGATRLGLTQSQPFARDGLFRFKAGFLPQVYCRAHFPTLLSLQIHEWSAACRRLIDALSPISFGPRPILWRSGGEGLRLPEGLEVVELDRELDALSPARVHRRLRTLALQTKPTRRMLLS